MIGSVFLVADFFAPYKLLVGFVNRHFGIETWMETTSKRKNTLLSSAYVGGEHLFKRTFSRIDLVMVIQIKGTIHVFRPEETAMRIPRTMAGCRETHGFSTLVAAAAVACCRCIDA